MTFSETAVVGLPRPHDFLSHGLVSSFSGPDIDSLLESGFHSSSESSVTPYSHGTVAPLCTFDWQVSVVTYRLHCWIGALMTLLFQQAL